VRVGTMLYLSGQIGNTPGTRQLADTGIAGQTKQAFENIKTVLAAAGSSLERVVKCTVFLLDIKDYAAMNAVYATYFPKDPPARSTVAGPPSPSSAPASTSSIPGRTAGCSAPSKSAA